MNDTENEPTESIAARILRLRLAAGMSQGKLALDLQSTSGRALVASWESGRKPGADWIIKIADAFGVSCDYLLLGHETEAPPYAPPPTI